MWRCWLPLRGNDETVSKVPSGGFKGLFFGKETFSQAFENKGLKEQYSY
jgi:hypothetical protein